MMGSLIRVGTMARILSSVGALNWGLVGLFERNLVKMIFGFSPALENSIYILVGLAGAYLLYRAIEEVLS